MAGSLKKLPGWVVSNAESVRWECARYKVMTLEQRIRVLESVLHGGWWQVLSHADPQRVIRWEDPIPQSSAELLARLRKEHPHG